MTAAYVLLNGQRVTPVFVLNSADGGGFVSIPDSFVLPSGQRVAGVVMVDEDGLIAPSSPVPSWRTGAIYDGNWTLAGGSMAGSAMVANTLYGMPIYIPKGSVTTKIGVNVTSAGAAGKLIRLGIARMNADKTGTLVLDGGAVAADALASPELDFAPDVSTGGWYYLLAISDGTPSIMAHISSASALLGRSSYASTVRNSMASMSQTYGALPTTFTPAAYATVMFAVGLKAG